MKLVLVGDASFVAPNIDDDAAEEAVDDAADNGCWPVGGGGVFDRVNASAWVWGYKGRTNVTMRFGWNVL